MAVKSVVADSHEDPFKYRVDSTYIAVIPANQESKVRHEGILNYILNCVFTTEQDEKFLSFNSAKTTLTY